jgi:hypothetical protein
MQLWKTKTIYLHSYPNIMLSYILRILKNKVWVTSRNSSSVNYLWPTCMTTITMPPNQFMRQVKFHCKARVKGTGREQNTLFVHPHKLVLESLTEVLTFRGEGSPNWMLSCKAKARTVVGRGKISGGGAKMSCPLSSLDLAVEICFFNMASDSLSKVPLSSRCFATSGRVVGFLGETLSSSANEM